MRATALSPDTRWSNRTRISAGAGLLAIVLSIGAGLWMESSARADFNPVAISWDGPTTNLAWDGSFYGTASGSIVGDVVIVPGDFAQRTAIVKNAGPSSAKVTVQILDVTTTNPVDAINDDLETHVHLYWDIDGHKGDKTWRDARLAKDPNAVTYTVSFYVDKDEEFPITAGYYFPVHATSGQNGGAHSSLLSFTIRIVMQGDDGVKISTGGTSSCHHVPTVAITMMIMGTAGLVVVLSRHKLTRR